MSHDDIRQRLAAVGLEVTGLLKDVVITLASLDERVSELERAAASRDDYELEMRERNDG